MSDLFPKDIHYAQAPMWVLCHVGAALPRHLAEGYAAVRREHDEHYD